MEEKSQRISGAECLIGNSNCYLVSTHLPLVLLVSNTLNLLPHLCVTAIPAEALDAYVKEAGSYPTVPFMEFP